ncbi:suppressor of fused domain protein [Ralstonia pseudosolanacearum]
MSIWKNISAIWWKGGPILAPRKWLAKKIQVVRFSGVPYEGASTFATLGLSDYVVDIGGGRSVRQELLFATRDCYPAEQVASFLVTFASFVRSKQRALLRGDVIGPSSPLISGVAANGLYASNPVIFPEGGRHTDAPELP